MSSNKEGESTENKVTEDQFNKHLQFLHDNSKGVSLMFLFHRNDGALNVMVENSGATEYLRGVAGYIDHCLKNAESVGKEQEKEKGEDNQKELDLK